MTGKNTDIDSLFKEGLKDAKVSPPHVVWQHVSAALDKKKSHKIMWMISRVAATVAILVSAVVIYWISFKTGDDIMPKQTISEGITINENKSSERSNQRGDRPAEALEAPAKSDSKSLGKQLDNSIIKNIKQLDSYTESEELAGEVALDERQPNLNNTPATQKNALEVFSTISVTEKKTEQSNLESIAGIDPQLSHIAMNETDPVLRKENKPNYYAAAQVKPKQEHKWQLGAFYAPLYSYRMVESADVSKVQNQIIQNSETGMVTYSGGLAVTYHAGRRLKISSGINVTKMGNAIENIVAYVSHYDNNEGYYADGFRTTKVSYQVNNSMGSIQTAETNAEFSNDPSLVDLSLFAGSEMNSLNTAIISNSSDIIQDFTYIELPVMLKYSIIESTIDLNLLTGVSSFLMLDNEVTFKSYGGNDVSGRTNNVKSTNFSGSIGLGLAYDVSGSVQVYIDPVFKLFLNSINTSSTIDTYPYSFGLYSGISFVF